MNEDYIIGKIKELMPDEHYKPQGVLYTQLKIVIQKDLSEKLSELFRAKKISYNKTLNDILINVTNE